VVQPGARQYLRGFVLQVAKLASELGNVVLHLQSDEAGLPTPLGERGIAWVEGVIYNRVLRVNWLCSYPIETDAFSFSLLGF